MRDRSDRPVRTGGEVRAAEGSAAVPERRTPAVPGVHRAHAGRRVRPGEATPPELARTLREIAQRLDELFEESVLDEKTDPPERGEASVKHAPREAPCSNRRATSASVDTTVLTIHRDGAIDAVPAGMEVGDSHLVDREDDAEGPEDGAEVAGDSQQREAAADPASTPSPQTPSTAHVATRDAGGVEARLQAARERMNERKAEAERAAEEKRGGRRRKARGTGKRGSRDGPTSGTTRGTTPKRRPLAARARKFMRRTARAAAWLAVGLALAGVSAVLAVMVT